MLIAVPSKGRPNTLKTLRVIPSATLYVPRNEAESYRACNPKTEVVSVPNEVKGITKTRNWILNNTDHRRVMFIDDDVKVCGWKEALPHNFATRTLSEDQWLDEFTKLFDLTEQLGLRVFGIATQSAPRAVYTYKPFLFHTYVTASCMGLINTKRTRFDESFPVKEDYELNLRLLKEDGAILGARYIYWENEHWAQAGGCKDYRTQAMELDAIIRLKKMYPGMISQIKRGGSEYSIRLDF